MSLSDQNQPENIDLCPCDQDAAHLAFDLARQFITIAIGGIGFTVGIAYASPVLFSSALIWIILLAFGATVLFGLLFIMHGIGILSQDKSYNVYIPSLRAISFIQILSAIVGIGLLCVFLRSHVNTDDEANSNDIQIKLGENILTYPNDSGKNYTIEIDKEKITFSATTP
jgi:hypothetical protein